MNTTMNVNPNMYKTLYTPISKPSSWMQKMQVKEENYGYEDDMR